MWLNHLHPHSTTSQSPSVQSCVQWRFARIKMRKQCFVSDASVLHSFGLRHLLHHFGLDETKSHWSSRSHCCNIVLVRRQRWDGLFRPSVLQWALKLFSALSSASIYWQNDVQHGTEAMWVMVLLVPVQAFKSWSSKEHFSSWHTLSPGWKHGCRYIECVRHLLYNEVMSCWNQWITLYNAKAFLVQLRFLQRSHWQSTRGDWTRRVSSLSASNFFFVFMK